MAVTGCGGGSGGGTPTSATPTPAAPTTVIQTIQVLNSDGTSLGTATFTGASGAAITLTMQSLKDKGIDTSKVDGTYFVLRESNQGDRLGAFVANTATGSLTFTPTTSTRVVWGMNTTNGADYAGAWNTGLGRSGIRKGVRYQKVARLTSQNAPSPNFLLVDGDMTTIVEGLELLNSAWNVGGLRYASLTYDSAATSGEMKAGIGTHSAVPNAGGAHTGDSFVVRPEILSQTQGRNITTAEALETLCQFDDLFGRDTAASLFSNRVSDLGFNGVGRDYIRFGVLIWQP